MSVIPFLVPSAYVLSIMILIGIYSLVILGMNLLMGYAGQISLGHASFYGIGAYASAYVTVKLGLPAPAGIAAGILISALIAFIVGIPTLKLSGHYLALATLGFGMIMFVVFKEWKSVTGGLNGFSGIPALDLFGLRIDTDFKYYYLIWFVVLAGIWISRNLIQSRVGRALRSIHGSEIAAFSVGVDIQKYKLQVFVLSACFASLAGSIYAHYVTFINPMLFGANTSIHFLIISVLGGSLSIWGCALGATVYFALSELLKDLLPNIGGHSSEPFQIVFFGLILVLILIYMPEGLSSVVSKMWNKAGSRVKMRGNDGGSP
jgi:branched-chain amino acid transport system permease protein